MVAVHTWQSCLLYAIDMAQGEKDLFGVSHSSYDENDRLVGHIPKCICQVIHYFMAKNGHSAVYKVTRKPFKLGV